MSIRIDILAAKAAHEEHVAVHNAAAGLARQAARTREERDAIEGCRPGTCALRRETWLAYMAVAGRWGLDADDNARMAEQYAGQTAELARPGTTYPGMRRAA